MASVPSLPGLKPSSASESLVVGSGAPPHGPAPGHGGGEDGREERGEQEDLSRALERLPVARAREMLEELEKKVALKQEELRTVVAERYPELIESADAIVAMKDSAARVSDVASRLPQLCRELLVEGRAIVDEVEKRSLEQMVTAEAAQGSLASTGSLNLKTSQDANEIMRLMLNAPSTIWTLIDERDFLGAACLFERCKRAMHLSAGHSGPESSGMKRFIKSQWTYLSQFPDTIFRKSCAELLWLDTEDQDHGHASAGAAAAGGGGGGGGGVTSALAAMILVTSDGKDAHAPRSLQVKEALHLLLKERTAAMARTVRTAFPNDPASVGASLCIGVRIVCCTVLDVWKAFHGRHGSSSLVEILESVLGRDCLEENGGSTKLSTLSVSALRNLCTEWLSAVLPRFMSRARSLLGGLRETADITSVRQAIWSCARAESFWGDKWTSTWDDLVDEGVLRRRKMIKGVARSSDLWSLVFSAHFAAAADSLLGRSLETAMEDISAAVNDVVLKAMGVKERLLSPHRALQLAVRVVQVVWSSIAVLKKDASRLTQPGDEQAGEAIAHSLRVKCATLAALLICRLRFLCNSIQKRQSGGGQDEDSAAAARYQSSNVAVVIWRLASLLDGVGGSQLRNAMQSPSSSMASAAAQRTAIPTTTVERGQAEAAFEIADADGDGEIQASELAEAFQAVGASVPDFGLPSVRLPEFMLFVSGSIREADSSEFLESSIRDIAELCGNMWEQCTFPSLSRAFRSACKAVKSLASVGASSAEWRRRYGLWEEVHFAMADDEQDEKGGGGAATEDTKLMPVMISSHLFVYLQALSRNLGSMIATIDFNEEQSSKSPFRHARTLAKRRAETDVIEAYDVVVEKMKGCPEAAKLQCLLDLYFLVLLMPGSSHLQSLKSSIEQTVDPIDLQTFMPHLVKSARSIALGSLLQLGTIFDELDAMCHASRPGAKLPAVSPVALRIDASCLVQINPEKIPRFELLPLALSAEPVAGDKTVSTATTQAHSKSKWEASIPAAASPGQQTDMLQAANQALAGWVQGSGLSSFWGGGVGRQGPTGR